MSDSKRRGGGRAGGAQTSLPPAAKPPQVIFALPPQNGTDYAMRIYNSDGSEPEMCGNGIRCLARFVADIDGAGARQYRVHTLAGLIQPALLPDGQVRGGAGGWAGRRAAAAWRPGGGWGRVQLWGRSAPIMLQQTGPASFCGWLWCGPLLKPVSPSLPAGAGGHGGADPAGAGRAHHAPTHAGALGWARLAVGAGHSAGKCMRLTNSLLGRSSASKGPHEGSFLLKSAPALAGGDGR